MRWLSDWRAEKLAGRRVLLRLDLNVPLRGGEVRDDFRIARAVPTVQLLLAAGAEVIVLSHLGATGASLAPVADYLERFFPVRFIDRFGAVPASRDWPSGGIVLLENLRLDSGEETNAPELADRLAKLGDLFVNEAFSVSHRAHASIIGLPARLPACAGLNFATEIRELSRLTKPEAPFSLILGGAKFGTKLPLIRRFLPLAEKIFVGGALAHSFFKVLGYEIGRSLYDDSVRGLEDLAADPRIVLPSEVLVQRGEEVGVAKPDQVPRDGTIVDAGPAALGQLAEIVSESQSLLWNGPLGNYEQGFVTPTHDLAQLIAHHGGHSVLGGGDTIAAISELKLFDQFGFVSTGGGAMLDFLAEGSLPGIKALEENAQQSPDF